MMSISGTGRAALLLVDIQKGFDNIEYWGKDRNNRDAEEKAGELLLLWRTLGLPVFHIKHCSSNPQSVLHETNAGNDFKDVVKPANNEPIIKKNVNSAFIGTNLKEQLDDAEITKLVIVGLTTDHCISTTTRMAGNLGFEVFLVSDATATFNRNDYPAELMHDTALASLNGEFATVVTTAFVKRLVPRAQI